MGATVVKETPKAGRPRRSSRQMLEEAAAELFLEQTYAGTTIEQIAQRAGVSRNTFFNYFSAKSDLLWVDIDDGLAGLARSLDECAGAGHATDAVRRALMIVADGFGPANVPWALTQYELMGTSAELEASALSRFMAQADLVTQFTSIQVGTGAAVLPCRAFSLAVLAATAAAAGVWAKAGVARGRLAPYVDEAVSPVCEGYRLVLAQARIDE
ncbi:TetR/AcrR family transcriptional regulator [Glaciibacter superstes]|uniref:TetR/AcrR family transcriptional regulator n=1 Tax=Glaciibacter superstes TaxID=501023 RepID=UPI0003B3BB5D|nr:TetR/AcrR family transcriptional regulator [Glaciibacter superstes]